MSKEANTETTTAVPEEKRRAFKRPPLPERLEEGIRRHSQLEGLDESHIYLLWLKEGERVYLNKFPIDPTPAT